MLCESKLQACSLFTLYLLSFEIILNVMADIRQGALCLYNFRSVSDVLLRNRRNVNIKARQEFFESKCWLLLEVLQEIIKNAFAGSIVFGSLVLKAKNAVIAHHQAIIYTKQ